MSNDGHDDNSSHGLFVEIGLILTFEGDNLVVFHHFNSSKICPDKRGRLIRGELYYATKAIIL
jgi:hypothetical protein